MMKNVPNITKNTSVIVVAPAVKRGLRKNRRSSIGSVARNSHAANAPRITTVSANVTTVAGDSQPRFGASMMP